MGSFLAYGLKHVRVSVSYNERLGAVRLKVSSCMTVFKGEI